MKWEDMDLAERLAALMRQAGPELCREAMRRAFPSEPQAPVEPPGS